MTTAMMRTSEIAEAANAAVDEILDAGISARMAALALMAKECIGSEMTVSLDDVILLAEHYPKAAPYP